MSNDAAFNVGNKADGGVLASLIADGLTEGNYAFIDGPHITFNRDELAHAIASHLMAQPVERRIEAFGVTKAQALDHFEYFRWTDAEEASDA